MVFKKYVKARDKGSFPLSKRPKNCESLCPAMRTLRQLFHRSSIRMGSVDNSRIHTTPIRNAGFVSFVSQSGCLRVRSGDWHDNRLRRQRIVRSLALAVAVAVFTWFAIESARALPLF